MKYYYEDDNIKLINEDTMKALSKLPKASVDMIFSDPPYFLSNNGITCENGKMVSVNKGKWDESKGFKEDVRFHEKWLKRCDRVLKDDGTIWISGTYHCIHQITYILLKMGYYIINEVVWYKPNAAPNLGCRCLTASHEILIWAKKSKKAKHVFNYDIAKTFNEGKQLRSLWEISTTPKAEKKFGKHPTQKPLKLLDRIIKISTNENDVILDLFCGSSTTGVSAIANNRRYIGIDNNEEFINLSKKRLLEGLHENKEEKIINKGENIDMNDLKAKPFLKWAGGKAKLIPDIESRYPEKLKNNLINTYIEPFIGGGALFFDITSKYNFDRIIINDINKELVLTYRVIKDSVNRLIEVLRQYQDEYNELESMEEKQEYFYNIREMFNAGKGNVDYNDTTNEECIRHASHMIFLNKSCFNGLYRENKKGGFNVPFGKKKTVNTFEEDNLLAVNKILQKTIILNGDFEGVEEYIDENTFIYLDPPYRPLKDKGSFKDYSKEEFNDETQERLRDFYKRAGERGAVLMESNSDPKNADEDDLFFDELYSEFNIDRISAARSINSKGTGRGKVSEILIMNYNVE